MIGGRPCVTCYSSTVSACSVSIMRVGIVHAVNYAVIFIQIVGISISTCLCNCVFNLKSMRALCLSCWIMRQLDCSGLQ